VGDRELSSPVIREAKPDEAGLLVTMMMALHAEVEQYGGVVRQGPKTRAWVENLVALAVEGGRGLALVVEIDNELVAGLLAVDVNWPYDTDFERSVVGFGTYVAKAYRRLRLADALYETATRILRERGYDAYFGAYLVRNDPVRPLLVRKGFDGYETSVVMRLKE
jgi:GNAT superfamily N-acetyltransferase